MCCARQKVNNAVSCPIPCHQYLSTLIQCLRFPKQLSSSLCSFLFLYFSCYLSFFPFFILFCISRSRQYCLRLHSSFLLSFTRPKFRLVPDPNLNTPLSIHPFYAFHEMLSLKTYFNARELRFWWRWKRMLRSSELTPCSLVGGYHPWRRRQTVPLSRW
jgi:hypothetical protein